MLARTETNTKGTILYPRAWDVADTFAILHAAFTDPKRLEYVAPVGNSGMFLVQHQIEVLGETEEVQFVPQKTTTITQDTHLEVHCD